MDKFLEQALANRIHNHDKAIAARARIALAQTPSEELVLARRERKLAKKLATEQHRADKKARREFREAAAA